jgi:hypothetical protein
MTELKRPNPRDPIWKRGLRKGWRVDSFSTATPAALQSHSEVTGDSQTTTASGDYVVLLTTLSLGSNGAPLANSVVSMYALDGGTVVQEDPVPTPANESITTFAGDGQTAAASAEYPAQLVAFVTAASGASLPGSIVTITALDGGSVARENPTALAISTPSIQAVSEGTDKYTSTVTSAGWTDESYTIDGGAFPSWLTLVDNGDGTSAYSSTNTALVADTGSAWTLQLGGTSTVTVEHSIVVNAAGAVAEDYFASGDVSYSAPGYWDWNGGTGIQTAAQAGHAANEGTYQKNFEIPGYTADYTKPTAHNNEWSFNLNGGQFEQVWMEWYLWYPESYVHVPQNRAITGEGGASGSISAGSNVLTIGSGSFDSLDLGKVLTVFGAGAAGGNLNSHISSVDSSTQVTLHFTAGTTVSGAVWDRMSGVGWPNWKFFTIHGAGYGDGDRPKLLLETGPSYTSAGGEWLRFTNMNNGASNLGGWHHPGQGQYASEDSTRTFAGASGTPLEMLSYFTKDAWNRFRMHVDIGSYSSWVDTNHAYGDGVFKVWLNDALVVDFIDVPFYPNGNSPDPLSPYFENGYFFGAASEPSPFSQSVFMDSFRMHVTDPGW